MATTDELVHFLFLVLLDVRTHALAWLAFHDQLLPVFILEHQRGSLRHPKLVQLPILLLTGQYTLVKKFVILARIKGVILNVRVVRLVVLVFYRLKLFLLVNGLIIVDQNRIDFVSLQFLILDSAPDYLTKPHP